MNYVSLGRTGVQVSQCFGTMNFASGVEQTEAQKMVDTAIGRGINFFDTANIYSKGQSEEMLGKTFQNNQKRHRIVLATKVHCSMDESDPNASNNHRRHIIDQCHASLRRLQTDYIDLFYLHRPSPLIPIDETLRALDDLVRAGKIRYIGTSDFAAWKLLESLWVSKEYGLNRVVCEQASYHLLDRRAERELIPMARSYGIAVVSWSPLAGGFLSGKYDRNGPRPAGTRFSAVSGTDAWADKHFTPQAFDVVETVARLAGARDCSPAQWALAWVGQQPGLAGPVIGPRNLQQLEDNLGAAEILLTEEEKKEIDRVAPPGRATVPYYLADRFADFQPQRYPW